MLHPLFQPALPLNIRDHYRSFELTVPSATFQPGQRWVSNTESELGLGNVVRSANRRVELSFPAAEEKRTYATDIAPLSRVRYEVGQKVSNVDGTSMLITEVEEHNGCLIYLGHD